MEKGKPSGDGEGQTLKINLSCAPPPLKVKASESIRVIDGPDTGNGQDTQPTPSAVLGDRYGIKESTKGTLTNERRIKLRQILDEFFSMGELRGLCFDMHIDFEGLAGETKPEKVMALIEFCEHRGRISELETRVYTLRPNTSLEDTPE